MNTVKTKTSLLTLAAAALLSLGAAATANAQDFTRPNTDIRALEVPADLSGSQAKPEFYALSYAGRSGTLAGDTAGSHYDLSTSVSRH